jgi:hypothetical protein
MSIILFKEIECYDNLLAIIHQSLNDLENSLKGCSVITEKLEEVFKSLAKNRVPTLWKKNAFLSIKKLGSWIFDLRMRIENIQVRILIRL